MSEETNQPKTAGSNTSEAAPKATSKKETPASRSAASGSPLKARRLLVWSMFWSWIGIWFFAFLRFFFPRTLFEPKTEFVAGYPSDFILGVDTRFQQDHRVWIVRNTERLFALYARCTHLGCTPDWKPSENKFKCPCHGSGYDSEGINFEGPAPRPLDRCHVELDATGRMVVDTSRLYSCPKEAPCQFDEQGAYLIAQS